MPGTMTISTYSTAGVSVFRTLSETSSLLGVSPNGEWLAETRYNSDFTSASLWLVNLAGEEFDTTSDTFLDEGFTTDWVDDEHLVQYQLLPEPANETTYVPFRLLNPFNGEIQLIDSLPEVPLKGLFWVGPRADKILYVQQYTNNWILYDTDLNLSSTLLNSRGNYMVAWSANGQRLALFSAPTEIGAGIVLTLLNPNAPAQAERFELPHPRSQLGHAVWSGLNSRFWSDDGQYLALELVSDTSELYILDVVSDTITSYCLSPDPSSELHWSNRGAFVAWGNTIEDRTTILDTATGQYATVEGLPIDWATFPSVSAP